MRFIATAALTMAGALASGVTDCYESFKPSKLGQVCRDRCNKVAEGGDLHGLCPTAASGAELAACVLDTLPSCKSYMNDEASDADDRIVAECKAFFDDSTLGLGCKTTCESLAHNGSVLCPNYKSGADLIACVLDNYSVCDNYKTDSGLADDALAGCKAAWDESKAAAVSSTMTKLCSRECDSLAPGGTLANACKSPRTAEDLINCVDATVPHCLQYRTDLQ